MKYRAAYLAFPQSAGIVLTTPEQSGLSDSELTSIACDCALSAGLIGDQTDCGQITRAEFDNLLCIGEWQE